MENEEVDYDRLVVLRGVLIQAGANPASLHAFSELTGGCATCRAPLNPADPYGTPCSWRFRVKGPEGRFAAEIAEGARCAACSALLAGMPRQVVVVQGDGSDGPRYRLCETCIAPFQRIQNKLERAAQPRRKHGGEWPR
jgi:hypothetical protein